MASHSQQAVFPISNTNAGIQAWAGFVEAVLVTHGTWVVTGDTGQTAPGSLTAATAVNEKRGYRVYRMDDALQSVRPVFMRIDYGSGLSALAPAMWVTIGTGSNGSGTITDIRLNDLRFETSFSSGQPTSSNCYGSADKNRAVVALFVNTGSALFQMYFGVERTKDSNGADSTRGLLVAGTTNTANGSMNYAALINLEGINQPPSQAGFGYVLVDANPSTFDGNVGVSLAVFFAGAALQPGLNWALSKEADFTEEATFVVTAYGSARTYQNTRNLFAPRINVAADADVVVNIRFD